jgi:hypothetical protein
MVFQGKLAGVAPISFLIGSLIGQPVFGWNDSYCQKVLFSGHEYKFNANSIDQMIANIESTDIDHLDGHTVRSPWEMGMLPLFAARKLGYQFQVKMISSWSIDQTTSRYLAHDEALRITRSILEGKPDQLSRLPVTNQKWSLLKSQSSSDWKDLQEVDPVTLYGFCAYFQPITSRRCFLALNQILEDMSPIQNITARSEIDEVLSDFSYQKPLTQLALEYISLIESGKKTKSRRLNEDLIRVLGSSEKAWKVLAVLASRGANFYKLFGFSSQKNFPTVAALGIIASSALVFDWMNDEKFSFPRGVKVSCDSGKAYHFWMAAYLSHRYRSKWASYLSSVAYQMKSKTEFRDPNRSFQIPVDAIANEKIRLDLAYAAAGSEFGMVSVSGGIIDIDHKIDLLENAAESVEPMSKEEASDYWNEYPLLAFNRWNQIFHPERAMKP